LAVLFISFSFTGPVLAGPDKAYFTDSGQFSYAKFLAGEGDYIVAAREFERLVEHFPSSPLLPEAQFRMAEAYFKAGFYHEAERSYSLFLANFSANPMAGAVRILIEEAKEKYLKEKLPVVVLDDGPLYEIDDGDRTIRAVQVMIFDGKSYAEVDGELKGLKEAGVDTVIVRVFHNRGDRYYPVVGEAGGARGARGPKGREGGQGVQTSGVYFSTTHAPVIEDILSRLVHLAHRNDLKVFAWMTTRYADYGLEEREDLACGARDVRTGGLYRCKGLDLFNEEAVRHLEALYSDLAGYDIDGILFQDDLVLKHGEGFGPHAEALFEEATGLEARPERLYIATPGGGGVTYTELFWRWASWKNKRLLDVAGRLKRVVRAKNPQAEFAINLMYESVTNPPYALAWLSQSLPGAVEAGFDYYSVMAYHRQMEEELGRSPEAVKGMIEGMIMEAKKVVREPDRVLIKLQTVDWKTGGRLPDGEVLGLLSGLKGLDDVSLALVPYRRDLPLYTGGKPF